MPDSYSYQGGSGNLKDSPLVVGGGGVNFIKYPRFYISKNLKNKGTKHNPDDK